MPEVRCGTMCRALCVTSAECASMLELNMSPKLHKEPFKMAVFDSVVMAAAAWWVTVAGSVSSQACAESCQISTAYYVRFAMRNKISYCRLNVRPQLSYYPSATKRHVCGFVSLCFEIAFCDSVRCCTIRSWGKQIFPLEWHFTRQTRRLYIYIHIFIHSLRSSLYDNCPSLALTNTSESAHCFLAFRTQRCHSSLFLIGLHKTLHVTLGSCTSSSSGMTGALHNNPINVRIPIF